MNESIRRLWHSHRYHLLVVCLYAAITCVITWPLVMNMRVLILGEVGDHWLWGWMAWWRKHVLMTGGEFRYIDLNGAPFGTDHAFRAYYATVMILALLSLVVDEIFALNAMILFAYLMTSTTTYALARSMKASRLASFSAGLIFGFSSYFVNHTHTNVDQSQLWVIPLFLLALVHFVRQPTYRTALIMGIVFGVGAHIHAYYGYFNTLAALTYFVVNLVRRGQVKGWSNANSRRETVLYLLAGGLAFLIYLPEMVGVLRDARGLDISPIRPANTLLRDRDWFFLMASRPWEYFIPPDSHPLFGGIADWLYPRIQLIGLRIAPTWFWYSIGDPKHNEQYLGYINLLLAGYGFFRWRKRTRAGTHAGAITDSLWPIFWSSLFVVGFLFSLPPFLPVFASFSERWPALEQIGIPLPNALPWLLNSPLRVVRRGVVLMILSLAIFAAWAIDDLLQRVQDRRAYYGLLTVLLAGFALEHMVSPVFNSATVPEEYQWLAEQPPGTIIHNFPFGQARDHVIQQRFHEQPITDTMAMDANFQGDNLNRLMTWYLSTIDAPDLVPKLSALGVDYVVNWLDPPVPLPDGLQRIMTTSTGEVYSVSAEPIPMIVVWTLSDGFWQGPGDWEWSGKEPYRIIIWNPLNQPVDLNLTIELDDVVGPGEIELTQTLSPQPDRIAISGIMRPNPYLWPPYDSAPLILEADIPGRLTVYPGETVLTLRWIDPSTNGAVLASIDIVPVNLMVTLPSWLER